MSAVFILLHWKKIYKNYRETVYCGDDGTCPQCDGYPLCGGRNLVNAVKCAITSVVFCRVLQAYFAQCIKNSVTLHQVFKYWPR